MKQQSTNDNSEKLRRLKARINGLRRKLDIMCEMERESNYTGIFKVSQVIDRCIVQYTIMEGHESRCEEMPDYSISNIVDILRNGTYSDKIFETERTFRVLHFYFGRQSTMEEIGRYFDISRQRVKQIITKEIEKLNRLSTISKELNNINSLLQKNPAMHMKDGLKEIYPRDNFNKDELRMFRRIINYLLKINSYNNFKY